MSLNYEIVRYKQGLNIKMLIHSVNQFKMHRHKELEFFLLALRLQSDILRRCKRHWGHFQRNRKSNYLVRRLSVQTAHC